MNATIRGLKGLLALGALTALGLLLRWVTTDSLGSATAQDLTSMASVAIGAVAWVAYLWLVLAVLATVLEQVPGVIGRSAALVATRITSSGSRALLRSALGVAAVTPLTIGVAHAATLNTGSQPWTSTSTDAARPWTATEPRSTIRLTDTSTPASTAAWAAREPRSTVQPTNESATTWRSPEKPSILRLTDTPKSATTRTDGQAAAGGQPAATERTAVPEKRVPAERVAVPDRPTAGAPTRYTDLRTGQPLTHAAPITVQPGDSLWSIAAAELSDSATDESVAARWPKWYAANRHTIGPDPDLIHPGQVLHTPAPAPAHPVPPTHQEK
jgi:LysM repeat protein